MNTRAQRSKQKRIKIDRLRDSRKATPLPLVGYMRVSKADGSQVLDLQHDALVAAGIPERNLYSDTASGKRDDRPGLEACLKALREGDTLVVWKLDRLGRNLRHLVNVVHDLTERGVGLRVLTGQGAAIDTTTAAGKLVFGIFAALADDAESVVMRSDSARTPDSPGLRRRSAPHNPAARRGLSVQGALPQWSVAGWSEAIAVSQAT